MYLIVTLSLYYLVAGDRVVTAFDIACGKCSACHLQNFSGCDTTNPSMEQQMMYHDRLDIFILIRVNGMDDAIMDDKQNVRDKNC